MSFTIVEKEYLIDADDVFDDSSIVIQVLNSMDLYERRMLIMLAENNGNVKDVARQMKCSYTPFLRYMNKITDKFKKLYSEWK